MGSSDSDLAILGDVGAMAGIAAGVFGMIGTVVAVIGFINAGGPSSS